jgi:hypothetical protein
MTGEQTDVNGKRQGRFKLVDFASDNPDDIWFGYVLR